MTTFPKEMDYTKRLNTLPEGTTSLSVVVTPGNGSSFSAGGSIITLDLPSRGLLVPNSMYIRYRTTITNATTAAYMVGTPLYTPFAKLETLINSSVVETVQNYNVVCNTLINTKLTHAQKAGFAKGFGLLDDSTTISYVNLNGRNIPAAGETYVVAGPMNCILANAEQLIPLHSMGAVRIQLTTESLTNMLHSTNTTTVTAITLTNIELCFDIVDIPHSETAVLAMADSNGNIQIKSQSFITSTQSIATGSSGNMELVYNQRLSSIKTLMAIFGKATCNRNFDSVDITNANSTGSVGGDYSFIVAGQQYPQRAISTVVHYKSAAFAELAGCWSAANDFTAGMSITPEEFSKNSGDATTAAIPGKFYIGTNVEKLHNSSLLTGISSQLSPISLRLNIGSTATDETHSSILLICYDALIEINPASRQVSVKQ
jgi:hypothetical protein